MSNRLRPKLRALPADVVAVSDYARLAPEFMEPATWAWLEGGTGGLQALQANRSAFEACTVHPRVLVDCTQGHTRTRLFGRPLAHPLLLAPIGYQALLHPQGEIEAARGALETPFVISSFASRRIGDIAAAASGPTWFQLYLQPEREQSLALVRAAEEAGCDALVLTLDVPIKPASHGALKSGFRLPRDVSAVNLVGFAPAVPVHVPDGESAILRGMMRFAPRAADVEWLRSITPLPIVAKGLTHPDDARRLLALGCDGLIVSNHGGRALEAAPATLRVLPAIRAAVGAGVPVLVDGGLRSGVDAFKAVALGADAVMVGRPYAHALAVAGALGVAHVLKLMREDLEVTMALAGCPTLDDITHDAVCDFAPGETP